MHDRQNSKSSNTINKKKIVTKNRTITKQRDNYKIKSILIIIFISIR